uniref:TF-B3 domain-containing protein n=1 Tax=Setaria italica TaxID=4555 RepID=K3YD21_SETIT
MTSPAAAAQHPRVLLRFTHNTLVRALARSASPRSSPRRSAPTGGRARPWPLGVEWDGEGAFLGGGWREFAAACGVEPGWDTAHKPQFLRVFPKDFMGKMLIPAKFVQWYIPKEHLLDNHMAIVSGPLGKVSHVELQMSQSEVFFGGGWSQFLVLHDITESNALLLRYEGNMVFTVKVFEPDGCQRESKYKDIKMQQSEQKMNNMKRKRENDRSRCEVQKRPKGSMTSSYKASSKAGCIFEIGPPAWVKKEINTCAIQNSTLYLPPFFCKAIGIWEPCSITLKTSMSSTMSWQARVIPYDHSSHHVNGLKRFYQDSGIKVGDVCTFIIIETTLWHVVIEPR